MWADVRPARGVCVGLAGRRQSLIILLTATSTAASSMGATTRDIMVFAPAMATSLLISCMSCNEKEVSETGSGVGA